MASRGPLDAPLPWASVTKLVTALRRARRGRSGASSRSTSRPGRRGRRSATCWPTRPASRRTSRRRSSAPGADADLLQRGVRPARRARRRAGRRAVRRARARLGPAARWGWRRRASRGRPSEGSSGRAATSRRSAASCSRRASCRRARRARRRRVAFPGLRGVLPGVRAPGPQRLGARLRDPGIEVAALDRVPATRRRRSATSGGAGPSSGSTRSRASRSRASPIGRSARGPGEAWPARRSRRRLPRAGRPDRGSEPRRAYGMRGWTSPAHSPGAVPGHREVRRGPSRTRAQSRSTAASAAASSSEISHDWWQPRQWRCPWSASGRTWNSSRPSAPCACWTMPSSSRTSSVR